MFLIDELREAGFKAEKITRKSNGEELIEPISLEDGFDVLCNNTGAMKRVADYLASGDQRGFAVFVGSSLAENDHVLYTHGKPS